jgi:hypothetical protein
MVNAQYLCVSSFAYWLRRMECVCKHEVRFLQLVNDW